MNTKETIDKAYGNIPKEIGLYADIDIQIFRGFRYYWLRLVRFFTR